MKRMIAMVALLAFSVSACTNTSAPSNAPAMSNANASSANAKVAATPTAATTFSDADVESNEKQVWDSIKKKDFDGFAALLADEEMYVSDDGIYDKAGTVKGVKMLDLTDVSLSDWKVVKLDKDAAVVTYTLGLKGRSSGRFLSEKPMRASTAWVNRGGKWLAIYHQDTEAREMPANQAASNANSKTPTKTATPGTTATTTTTTKTTEATNTTADANDPIAKEKAMWEMLKKNDVDGFGNQLSDDSLEVEAEAVYDKAGSVKSAKDSGGNFGGLTESDFKTVKIDDDAAIVTYTVKGSMPGAPKPIEERHTTIWVNRGGKWMAAFHQGTPAMTPKK